MKKTLRKVAILLLLAFFASVIIQFGYNMLFVQEYASETTKGGEMGYACYRRYGGGA